MLPSIHRAVSRCATSPSSLRPSLTTTTTASRGLATAFAEEDKAFHVYNLLEAKKKAGVTFDEIAGETGLTNAYVAQVGREGGEGREGRRGREGEAFTHFVELLVWPKKLERSMIRT